MVCVSRHGFKSRYTYYALTLYTFVRWDKCSMCKQDASRLPSNAWINCDVLLLLLLACAHFLSSLLLPFSIHVFFTLDRSYSNLVDRGGDCPERQEYVRPTNCICGPQMHLGRQSLKESAKTVDRVSGGGGQSPKVLWRFSNESDCWHLQEYS